MHATRQNFCSEIFALRHDNTEWWQPAADQIVDTSNDNSGSSRIVINTNGKWYNHGKGQDEHGVICAKSSYSKYYIKKIFEGHEKNQRFCQILVKIKKNNSSVQKVPLYEIYGEF